MFESLFDLSAVEWSAFIVAGIVGAVFASGILAARWLSTGAVLTIGQVIQPLATTTLLFVAAGGTAFSLWMRFSDQSLYASLSMASLWLISFRALFLIGLIVWVLAAQLFEEIPKWSWTLFTTVVVSALFLSSLLITVGVACHWTPSLAN
jgi:hypothetical protein